MIFPVAILSCFTLALFLAASALQGKQGSYQVYEDMFRFLGYLLHTYLPGFTIYSFFSSLSCGK